MEKSTANEQPAQGSAPRPTPGQLARFKDPKTRVKPVDYTAVPSKPAPAPRDNAPRSGAQGASAPKPGPAEHTPKPGPRDAAPKPGPRQPAAEARTPQRIELVPPPGPAPEDAVVTINPDDPRPYTRPLRVLEDEVRTVSGSSLAVVTHDVIVLTVADPEEVWSSDNGTSDHYCRGEWTVQVRRADNHVIGAFPSRYALAVRPDDVDPVDPAELAGKSNRKKRGTRHPGDVRALKKRLEEHGFVVSSSGATHGKVTHPNFPGLFTPWASTPSDRRHPQMVTAQVKRVFGIDIRG